MNKLKINDIKYITPEKDGNSFFVGQPCPTFKMANEFSPEEIAIFDKKIKELLQFRIELFGKKIYNNNGFHHTQHFFVKKINSVIELKDIRSFKDVYAKNHFFNSKDIFEVFPDEDKYNIFNYTIDLLKEVPEDVNLRQVKPTFDYLKYFDKPW